MGIDDVQMIGVGKDEYNASLDGMIDENILPWVEDFYEEGYPVWTDYDAVQRLSLIHISEPTRPY